MKTIQELEKNFRQNRQYYQGDTNPYKQNNLVSVLDNPAAINMEKAINHYFNDEYDFYNETALDNEKDLNSNDPYPDDEEDETDNEDLDNEDLDDEDEIEDEDSEDDLDDEDDFQEDDLEDADSETDATNPRNPSQF
jgi:hypothetical protein